MFRKVSLIAISLALLGVIFSPCMAEAQTGPRVLESSVQAEYPASLEFTLSAGSDVNITDVRLRYKVEQISFADVTSEADIQFSPASSVSVSWSWDMRESGGLPPGVSVSYWWIITDASGRHTQTAPANIDFDDTRYPWHSLSQDYITLYWYEGDDDFVRELLTTSQEALVRLAQDTGAQLQGPAQIYVYASSQDMLAGLLYVPEWAGGVTYTRNSVIPIAISPSQLAWGEGAVAHELTHLVIGQMTLNPYINLPTWLDEGLATYNQGLLEPMLASALADGVNQDKLISVRTLCNPFPASAQEAYLSYGESFSIVSYLISQFGQARMLGLLNTFKTGASYDEALLKAYGFDIDGLDAKWREYVMTLFGKITPTTPVSTTIPKTTGEMPSPVLVALFSALGTASLLALGLALESWTWKRNR